MKFLVIFTNGQILEMRLERRARRYFWVSDKYELAVSVEDADITQCVPIVR